MPTITTASQASQLAKDSTGKIVEGVSLINWRPSRKDVTAGAWVNLADGNPRSAIYIKNTSTTDTVIIAPASTGYSNDPTNDTCGLSIGPGEAIEPTFGAKLGIFARTAVGGGTARLIIVESF